MKNLITCLVVGALSSVTFATTWTVDDDGKADFDNIQAAVDAASDGDEIIVMPGTYTSTANEVVDMRGKEVWLHSSKGAEVTIIDGEDTRRGIMCKTQETSKTIIEGFTITNCYGESYGGGMHNTNNSGPTITDCTFTNNFAYYDGGGMYSVSNSSSTLTSCTFIGNAAGRKGGGMSNHTESSPVLTGCTFTNNSAECGGGMSNYSSSPTLTNCTITGNTAIYFMEDGTGRGGGLFNISASPVLINCEITDNFAEQWGGGMCNDQSNPDLDGCVISGNSAYFHGGGMYNAASVAWISNSSFCLNDPDHIYGAWVDLDGNTFDVDCGNPSVCIGDANSDYNVDVLDLLYVIAVWGTDNQAGDINEDGWVDVSDLLEVISGWGACP